MLKLKRYGAILIILSMLIILTVVPYSTTYAEDSMYYTNIMTALGIYDSEDYMDNLTEKITREELASILSIFYGIKDKDYPANVDFLDVPVYWASGHILTMVNNGILNGYEDGLFRPEANVTAVELMKILVSMTGYKVIADINGGYPDGYVYAANRIGLFKGVEITDSEAPVSKEVFTKMLYNAINADLYEQTGFSFDNKVYTTTKEKTLLSEKLDIYEIRGRVYGTENISLDFSEVPGKGRIKINNTIYECGFNTSLYIGLNVKGYYHMDTEDIIGEILYIEDEHNGDDYIEVNAKDISSLTDRSMTYEIGDNMKIANIPGDAVVVFNGRRESYVAVEKMKPKHGSVRLIDSNTDGKYEYVVINSFMNLVVTAVSNDDGIYTIAVENSNPIVINTNLSDMIVTVNDRDRICGPESIKKGDVISVMADMIDFNTNTIMDECTSYMIYRTDVTVTGTCNSIFDTDKITIDGAEYDLAGDYDFSEYPITMGEEYTFLLNYLGEVCGFADSAKTGFKYGILLTYNLKDKLDTSCKLKIFDSTATFITAPISEKAYIDGYYKKSYDASIKYLKDSSVAYGETTATTVIEDGVWQIIKYSINVKGEIDRIDTILPDETELDSNLQFSGRTNPSGTSIYLNSLFWSPPNTNTDMPAISFLIPEKFIGFLVSGDLETESSYGTFNKSNLKSGKYDIKLFDMDKMNVPEAMVMHGSASIDIQEKDNTLFIEKIYEKLDDDRNKILCVKGVHLFSGNSRELAVSDDTLITTSGVRPGDIIQYNADATNCILSIRVALSMDGSGACITNSSSTKSAGGSVNYSGRFSLGTVVDYDTSYITQKFTSYADSLYDYTETNFRKYLKYVYIFNTKSNTLKSATVEDLRTIKSHGADKADKVACVYNSNQMAGMVIYR